MIPRATYRMQFHKDFTFADGEKAVPYLAGLGISHLYASPIMKARPGSQHGYDVVDHSIISPELGGETGFRALAAKLRAYDMGIILDIVPNHMAVGVHNQWWFDVLEKGRGSTYADYFDIEWNTFDPRLKNKIFLPVLGAPFEEVLASGEIKLSFDEAEKRIFFAYFDHRFPLRREDYPVVAGDVEKPIEPQFAKFSSADALAPLLERQNFLLGWWRTAGDRINWRRFFDISDLAGLRIEHAAVFEAVHAVPFALYSEGLIDGVRIDHIDGLSDPAAYCRDLRARFAALDQQRPAGASRGEVYIVVEKILAHDEVLPSAWHVHGTTGYDFMNQVSRFQHSDSGDRLGMLWHRISRRPEDFETEEIVARNEILLQGFAAQLDTTIASFAKCAAESAAGHDIGKEVLGRCLVRLMKQLRFYRTYATGDNTSTVSVLFGNALSAAKAGARHDEAAALGFINQVLTGQISGQTGEAARRFNQLSAPVAAKAVEDTGFYRYARLLSRNDVGFDPRFMSMPIREFHGYNAQRRQALPHAMLTTATHDHKRGEDGRARLAVLSEIPDKWEETVNEWFALTAALKPVVIDDGDIYQLFQSLVGAWPPDLARNDLDGIARLSDRMQGWRVKSLREAKLRTSWTEIDNVYEQANCDFLSSILDPEKCPGFLDSLCQFLDYVMAPGAANALVQAALRCTLPGVPDIYQGCEYWDFSLVDPDNRRPVDFVVREQALFEAPPVDALTASWRHGRIKQRLITTLLNCRKHHPELFSHGTYEPIEVSGPRADNAIAFARRWKRQCLVIIGARHLAATIGGTDLLAPEQRWWGNTRISLQQFSTGNKCSGLDGNEFMDKSTAANVAVHLRSLPIGAFFIEPDGRQ